MRIDFNYSHVRPYTESLSPQMSINLRYLFNRGTVLPMEFYGELRTADGKVISNLIQRLSRGNRSTINGNKKGIELREENESVSFIVPLSKEAIDHIEIIRQKEAKKDVHLNVKICCKYLSADIHLIEQQKNINTLVVGEYPSLFSIDVSEDSMSIHIAASTWVHDYINLYKKSKYILLEIPKPEAVEGSNFLEEKLNAAIDAIPKMEKELEQGEWTEVIEKARPIIELIREKEREPFKELTQLLIDSGLSEDAVKNLTASLNQLFQFSSIFIHKIDEKGRRLNPEIIASKEDAYLIYSMCMHIIHLIAKKISKRTN